MIGRSNSHDRGSIYPSIFMGLGWICLGLQLTSCAILFPDRSAPKNHEYIYTTPVAPWRSVPVGEDSGSVDALKADTAFENPESGAIISLNSICRKYFNVSLDELSRNLVLGIADKKIISERQIKIDGVPAKDTLLLGVVKGTKVKIRTVVAKKNYCTFDFIFVATPETYPKSVRDFESFMTSFHVE